MLVFVVVLVFVVLVFAVLVPMHEGWRWGRVSGSVWAKGPGVRESAWRAVQRCQRRGVLGPQGRVLASAWVPSAVNHTSF